MCPHECGIQELFTDGLEPDGSLVAPGVVAVVDGFVYDVPFGNVAFLVANYAVDMGFKYL